MFEISRAESTSSTGAPVPSPFQERAESVQRLEYARQRKSQSEVELEHLKQERKSTPMSAVQLNLKDIQILEMQQRINAMELTILRCQEQLRRAEETISQQRTTIHNQSKAIENPRPGRALTGTPHRQNNHEFRQYSSTPRHGGMPPPAWDPQGSFSTTRDRRPSGTATHEVTHQGHNMPPPQSGVGGAYSSTFKPILDVINRHTPAHSVNDFGSPQATRSSLPCTPSQHQQPYQHGGAIGVNNTGIDPFGPDMENQHVAKSYYNTAAEVFQPGLPQTQGRGYGHEVTWAPLESANASMALIPASSYELNYEIKGTFERVFHLVSQYAVTHLNFPSTAGDQAIPDELKHRLLRAATVNSAFLLMSKAETRYWLITKVMIQWLIKHILKPNTFSGLDKDIDQIIAGTRASIYQSTPAVIRFLSLRSIANELTKITEHEHFADFKVHLIKQRSQQLFWMVRPLKNGQTLRDEQDIEELVRAAHDLAQLMFTHVDEYRFDFAETGKRFDRYTMINVDPVLGKCTDDEMRARYAQVRLGATPEVIVRKNNEHGTGAEVKMHKGRVLLKVREQQDHNHGHNHIQNQPL